MSLGRRMARALRDQGRQVQAREAVVQARQAMSAQAREEISARQLRDREQAWGVRRVEVA